MKHRDIQILIKQYIMKTTKVKHPIFNDSMIKRYKTSMCKKIERLPRSRTADNMHTSKLIRKFAITDLKTDRNLNVRVYMPELLKVAKEREANLQKQ